VCYRDEDGEYFRFAHEGDILLFGLHAEYEAGRLPADKVRQIWLPYRAFWEELYDPEEWEDDEFPIMEGVWEVMPATSVFQEEIARLRIPGVEAFADMGRPMSYPAEIQVKDSEALAALSRAVAGRYHIVAAELGGPDGTTGLDDARRFIEWARAQPAFHERSWQA
jgi:hypothetical protein